MTAPSRARLVAVLSSAWLAACASPAPYYAENPPALPALDETHRDVLEEALAEKIVASGIEEVEIVERSGTRRIRPVAGRAPEFREIPLEALEAATFGATKEARGAEFDLLVRREEVSPGVIVTVRHDLDGRLVVVPGEVPISLDGPDPSASELRRRFGIGPLLDGDVAWTASDRRALAAALGLMTPEEIDYLRDLPFRREAGGREETHAGYYVIDPEAGGGVIILLDRAFEFDGTSFVGTPERAYPQSIEVILHEMGHAVAKLDQEKLSRIYERDRLAYNEAVPVVNEFVDALNDRYAIVGRVPHRQQRKLDRDIRLLERTHRKNRAVMRKSKRRLDELERRIEQPSPMKEAYGTLPGARRGPTEYGRTSVEEGFAEAFALYHLDPDSIRRISPEVHDWFAASHHLSAALYPPLDRVTAPSTLVSPTEGQASPP